MLGVDETLRAEAGDRRQLRDAFKMGDTGCQDIVQAVNVCLKLRYTAHQCCYFLRMKHDLHIERTVKSRDL